MFNIDVNKILPYLIDAYSLVYGVEYYDTISSKINNSIVIQYYDLDGYEDYLSYIKRCKRRELALLFLNTIGFNFNDVSCSKQFDEEILNVLEIFLGSEFTCFDSYLDKYFSPICAFDSRNNVDNDKLLQNKLLLINYLLYDKNLLITEDNFDYFIKTPEYNRLIKKITFYYHIYLSLRKKYEEFEELLIPYQDFINNEKEKQNNIFSSKKDELFNEVFPLVTDKVKLILKKLDIEEQKSILLGTRDLSYKTPIEYFSRNDMDILYSDEVSIDEKYWIIFFQSNYLKSLGLIFSDEYLLSKETSEYVESYLTYINSNNVKVFLPSDETIKSIENIRINKHNEALLDYYTTRDDFKKNYHYFVDSFTNRNFLYNQIVSNDVCVIECGGKNSIDGFISIMFFTFKKNFGGKLMHCFTHEIGHIIDQNENGCGFESSSLLYDSSERNKYDSSLRKYEKFNEAINDIYTLEVLKKLNNQGVYLIEDRTFACNDTSSFNTSIYIKQLLLPLLENYKYYVSKAKIYANPNYLIEAIGFQNYESLVDIVNKVNYLVDAGLFNKSSNNIQLEQEYHEQLLLLDTVYENISNYHGCIKHLLVK